MNNYFKSLSLRPEDHLKMVEEEMEGVDNNHLQDVIKMKHAREIVVPRPTATISGLQGPLNETLMLLKHVRYEYNRMYELSDKCDMKVVLERLKLLNKSFQKIDAILHQFLNDVQQEDNGFGTGDPVTSSIQHAVGTPQVVCGELVLTNANNSASNERMLILVLDQFLNTLNQCIKECEEAVDEEVGVHDNKEYCKILLEQLLDALANEVSGIGFRISVEGDEIVQKWEAKESVEQFAQDNHHRYKKVAYVPLACYLNRENSDLSNEEKALFGSDERRARQIRMAVSQLDGLVAKCRPTLKAGAKIPAKMVYMLIQQMASCEGYSLAAAYNIICHQYALSQERRFTMPGYSAVHSWSNQQLNSDENMNKFKNELTKAMLNNNMVDTRRN